MNPRPHDAGASLGKILGDCGQRLRAAGFHEESEAIQAALSRARLPLPEWYAGVSSAIALCLENASLPPPEKDLLSSVRDDVLKAFLEAV